MKSRTSMLAHQLPGLNPRQQRSFFTSLGSAAVPSMAFLLAFLFLFLFLFLMFLFSYQARSGYSPCDFFVELPPWGTIHQERQGVSRDHQFFVGRNDVERDPALRLRYQRFAGRIGGRIELHSEPRDLLRDPGADRRRVLAD